LGLQKGRERGAARLRPICGTDLYADDEFQPKRRHDFWGANDLVITVDTTNRRILAGGAGKPTVVLLRRPAIFADCSSCGTTPLYPNDALFRQSPGTVGVDEVVALWAGVTWRASGARI